MLIQMYIEDGKQIYFISVRNKNKAWLAQNQDNVSEWSDCGLLYH